MSAVQAKSDYVIAHIDTACDGCERTIPQGTEHIVIIHNIGGVEVPLHYCLLCN